MKKNGAIIEVGFISSHCEDGKKMFVRKVFLVCAEKKCENELLKKQIVEKENVKLQPCFEIEI